MDNTTENKLAGVRETATQAREIPCRWAWVEPSVWTARMLTALEEGVRGGKWYSLMDKVYALSNLRAAFKKVKANGGAAGVDHQTVEMYERHLEENLEKLSQALKAGKYHPQAVRRVWIPKLGSKDKRPLGVPTVCAYCTSYSTASESPRLMFRILEERRIHSNRSCSFSALIVIQ
jgi:RNA-directed DNA polymerase